MNEEIKEAVSSTLLHWYDRDRRHFPWRATEDPYGVWVSEVMLQQTQTSRVIEYFIRWMTRFPSLQHLAAASEQEVIQAWEGLGYYSRARNMHRAAQSIVAGGGTALPATYDDLRRLPGVGEYTASAVASIAFGQSVPAMDANALRVFSRLGDIADPVDRTSGRRAIRRLFERLISKRRPGDFNQAVMDLGATICLPKNPLCSDCPLAAVCLSRLNGTTSARPVLAPPVKRTALKGDIYVLLSPDGAVFLRSRPTEGLWAGFEEFPWSAPPLEGRLPEEIGRISAVGTKIGALSCAVTRWSMALSLWLVSRVDPSALNFSGRWVDGPSLAEIPLPSASRKARELLFRRNIVHRPQRPAESGRRGE